MSTFWNVFNPYISISREKNLKIKKNEKKKKKKNVLVSLEVAVGQA